MDGKLKQAQTLFGVEFPERLAPFHKVLATPDIVHEHVKASLLATNGLKEGSDLFFRHVAYLNRDATPPAAVTISAVSSMVSGLPSVAGLPHTLRPVQ